VSDIGFHGIVAAIVGVAMLAAAAAGLLTEAVLWRRRRRDATTAPGAVAFLAPALYALLALIVLVAADRGTLELKGTLDTVAPGVAVIGLLVWLGLRIKRARTAAAAVDG
jgi:hypothetical protein